MSARIFFFCFLLSAPALAFAGHGFMTAFGNIEWLPEPGRTPDSAWYRLDAWQEEGQLLLACDPEAKDRLCLTFAREKLAEVEAMVKAENAQAAETAADRYREYVDRAKRIVSDGMEPTAKESLAEVMANALLEHQYILSVIYEELPASTRAVVPRLIAAAQERYQDVTRLLPPKKKGALFFKEEEVRWSVQMAMRADENNP
ncbi:MAG: hypothetical protein HYZ72_21615 [Deltaproteobacteria bacterium]|nr:hypothetical protein [Deltaproteobacteria bacterium]